MNAFPSFQVPAPKNIVKKATVATVQSQKGQTTEQALAGYDYLKNNSKKNLQ